MAIRRKLVSFLRLWLEGSGLRGWWFSCFAACSWLAAVNPILVLFKPSPEQFDNVETNELKLHTVYLNPKP